MPIVPLEVFANNPSTTVSAGGTTNVGGVSGTQETWTVASSASFPAAKTNSTQFHVADPALPAEVVTVVNISGVTWTVIRGSESTTPVAHTAGFTVVQVVTAGALAALQYQPWQFPVQAYGAVGDGQVIFDATIAGGALSTLNSASGLFRPEDTGNTIMINGAKGTTSTPLVTTITYVLATQITLGTAASIAVTNAPACWFTDDTAAINAAITAAAAYAVSSDFYAEVIFGARIYGLTSGPTQTTTPAVYNSQLQMPYPDLLGATRKLVIAFTGAGENSHCHYWDAKSPNMAGTCLISTTSAPSTPSGTYFTQSVMGGPSAGGAFTGGFANVKPVISGISVWCGAYTNQTAFDLTWCAAASVPNASAHIFTTPLTGVQPLLDTMNLRASSLPRLALGCGCPPSATTTTA